MYQLGHDLRRLQMDDNRTRTPFPKLTSLAQGAGDEEYRLAVGVRPPVVSIVIALLV
jgi:hypothetical protein